MDALRGFTLLLLCQSAGEALARLAHWPLPGPVLGLVLLVGLLPVSYTHLTLPTSDLV